MRIPWMNTKVTKEVDTYVIDAYCIFAWFLLQDRFHQISIYEGDVLRRFDLKV